MNYSDFLNANMYGSNYVYVIAEIGKNFIDVESEENEVVLLEKAINLVKEAKKAGADAVKFQTHTVSDEVLKIDFSSPHFSGVDRYYWVKRNEVSTTLNGFWKPLKSLCMEIGIEFFSTPMSKGAAIKLEELGVDLWKIGSADVSDYVLVDFLSKTKKPIIISTGMVSLKELENHINVYRRLGVKPAILYCISKYPCPMFEFNMSTINLLRDTYPDLIIGFSDHSVDGHLPVLCAVRNGARIIEKHFTIDRNAWGSDHKASLLPSEFAEMTELVRKGLNSSEIPNELTGAYDRELEGAKNIYRKYFEKGLVLAHSIAAGEVFELHHFNAMRPLMSMKVPASELYKVLGRRASRNLNVGEIISNNMMVANDD